MKITFKDVLIIIISMLLAWVILTTNKETTERVSVEYRDSIVYIRDTVVDTVFSEPKILHYISTDTIIFRDSIYVPIPINRYTFHDKLYKFTVDGYNVKPISLEVYPETKTIYKDRYITRDREVVKLKRVNHGLIVGVGGVYGTKGLDVGLIAGYGLIFNF